LALRPIVAAAVLEFAEQFLLLRVDRYHRLIGGLKRLGLGVDIFKLSVAIGMFAAFLLVTRLDRLARSTRDLLNTLAAIAAKGARFRSLADTWADTTTAHGRLILTVLGGLAEFERDLIRTRTSEGRARAKAQGVKLGRKPTLTQHQKEEAIKRRKRGTE